MPGQTFCRILAIAVVVFLWILNVAATNCNRIDDCSCKWDDGDGAVINLKPLLTKTDGRPLFQDERGVDGYYYSYNICQSFTEVNCIDSTVCQRKSLDGPVTSLGVQQNMSFDYDGHHVIIIYVSRNQPPTRVVVTLLCVQNQTTPLFKAFGFENYTNQYQFELWSTCACDNACKSESQQLTTSSLLIVSVLLIT